MSKNSKKHAYNKEKMQAREDGRLLEFMHSDTRVKTKTLDNGYIALTTRDKDGFRDAHIVLSPENVRRLVRDLTDRTVLEPNPESKTPEVEITSAGLMVFRDHELEMELLGRRKDEWERQKG